MSRTMALTNAGPGVTRSQKQVIARTRKAPVAAGNANANVKYTKAEEDLAEKTRRHRSGEVIGGYGSEEFSRPTGITDFIEFKEQHPEYYDTAEEPSLLRRHADVCAELVKKELSEKGKPLNVTVVSRGPGSEFLNKEGVLIAAFERAGIAVDGVVLIDRSLEALNISAKEVSEILPNAKIQTLQDNIFSARTGNKIELVPGTTEVGTCFGLTPSNIDGLEVGGASPSKTLERQLKGIRGQMQEGAFFFATYDHNPDQDSIEKSYSGRRKMVRNFLKEVFGVTDTKNAKYTAPHNIDTNLTAHTVTFYERTSYKAAGKKWFSKGASIIFNLSYKPSKDVVITANNNAGFNYPNVSRHPDFSDLVLMGADQKRLGLHANIAG